MAKPWRMVTLHVGSWVALALVWLNGDAGRSATGATSGATESALTVLDWTCLVVVIGCVQTIVVRLNKIFRALREKGGRK